jgi:hypothetical protein
MKKISATFTIIYAFVGGVVIFVTILSVDKFKDNIPGGLWGRIFVVGIVGLLLVLLRSFLLRFFCRKTVMAGDTEGRHTGSP